MSDRQFRLSVLAVALVMIASITYLRFCGSVSLPAKSLPPTAPTGTQTQLLSKSTSSPAIYSRFLQSDAALAGARAPTIEEMSRAFAYRVDDTRRELAVGTPIEVAGLRLTIERSGDQVVMAIENTLSSAAAYRVMSGASDGCAAARPLPTNAMVIGIGATERRTECAWNEGMSIIVMKVETIAVPPLAAWYLSQVPPTMVGVEERIARGHRGIEGPEKCSPVLPQVVRTGLDRGEIGWRDLVDFYARHRCQTYQFQSFYRAFTRDNERSVPSTD